MEGERTSFKGGGRAQPPPAKECVEMSIKISISPNTIRSPERGKRGVATTKNESSLSLRLRRRPRL